MAIPDWRSTVPARIRLLEPWRTRVLWLSLGFNVFAAALFAAPLLAPLLHPRPPPGPPGFDRLVGRMAGRMPKEDAERFRAAMDRERPWYEMTRERLDEARVAMAHAVGRPDFDPAQARAAFAAMQERLRESSGRFDESLVSALEGVSAEGRARLAQEMGRRRP